MKRGYKKRVAFGTGLGLDAEVAAVMAGLDTPHKIQDYVSSLGMNYEEGGDTCRSAACAIQSGVAHCIEGAFISAAALWMGGSPPLLMDMQASEDDDDHVIALFRSHGCWGAISKSNHVWLRWRDPVYRTLRELAMSYFHEYANEGKKTLRTYSASFDLRRFPNETWMTNQNDCWDVAQALDDGRHYHLLTPAQSRILRQRDRMEMKADKLLQYAD